MKSSERTLDSVIINLIHFKFYSHCFGFFQGWPYKDWIYTMEVENSDDTIKVYCLGAGQEVGRSCVLVTLSNKTIMFDVGIHMLYTDHRRYPDFSKLYSPPQTINDVVDLVIITHFHLDHCGALPYLTEHHGYKGPILTSTPTKALLPIMLEDYRKVMSDGKKEEQFYSFGVPQVKGCTSKVKSMGLFQTLVVDGIRVTSYYAGHVLGACMYHVQYDGLSAVYTGDYNSYADRHLGAASAPRLRPNILITETTYATTIRDTKRDRERSMLHMITQTVDKGGKVLIPVFALGRAQELSVLLQTYWKRTDSNIPIYFSAGLIDKANLYYRLFSDWQNEKIQEQFAAGDNVFQFKKVKPFDKSLIRADTPYVLFATPGMLHSGTSVQVFKEWCGDERNTLIIPGYCVEGTLGNRLINKAKEVIIDKKTYQVKMRVENVSFSAHADAKGIINLLRNIDPYQIIFVHGDRFKMAAFKPVVEQQLQRDVYMPPNHQLLTLKAGRRTKIPLKEYPIFSEGYLLQNSTQFCLIQQQKLIEQANRLLELAGEESIAVKKDFKFQFTTKITSEIESLKDKYAQNLKFEFARVKKQEGQPDYLNEPGTMTIKGSMPEVISFIKQASLTRNNRKYY